MTDLAAGPQLDALIAEKVMHRKRSHLIRECEDTYYSYCEICGRHNDDWMLEESPCNADPAYSSDMSLAWGVAESLAPAWLVSVERCVDGYEVSFSPGKYIDGKRNPLYDADQQNPTGSSDTAPHAICLAALEAVNKLPPKNS